MCQHCFGEDSIVKKSNKKLWKEGKRWNFEYEKNSSKTCSFMQVAEICLIQGCIIYSSWRNMKKNENEWLKEKIAAANKELKNKDIQKCYVAVGRDCPVLPNNLIVNV